MKEYVDDMIDLKNTMMALINLEGSLDDKLDLLTAVEIETSNDQLFQVCEAIRHEICLSDSTDSKSRNQTSDSVAAGQERQTHWDLLLQETSNEGIDRNDGTYIACGEIE